MKTLVTFVAVAVLFCSLATGGNPNPNTEFLKSNPIYDKSCAKCHGKNAEGRRLFGAGPSLISEKIAATSPEELRNIIVNGKGKMPKFGGKLSTADIDAIVQQIKAANTQ